MTHPFQTASDVRKCPECGAEAPAHYGSCSKVAAIPGMTETLAGLDREKVERDAREKKRLGEVAAMQDAGRDRLKGRFLALSQDTKFMSFDRDVFRNMTMLTDAALDALSLQIRKG